MAKILIIDDRALNRQYLSTLLSYQRHRLLETRDGAEGLRIAREERPDLIISDVLMPTMDGYEFVRRLREDPAICDIPVVFSTAHYLGRECQALADKCGVTSTIFKPCEPQVVLDIIEAALSGHPEPAPALATPEEFDREHLQLLTSKLSEKANRLREAHAKLTALMEFGSELARERDPVQLLNRYCSVAREVIGAGWSLVALLGKDRKAVQHLGVIGIDAQDTPARQSALLETGIFVTLMKEGRPIRLSDVSSTPAALRLPDSLPRARSLLVAPLAIRGHVDGWICLADKLGFDTFSEQDERLAMDLAAKMAVAYDNARLYSESMKYAGRLEAEISERAKVERQLSESKARLAGIINSAMDSIITIDSDQRVLMFNGGAEKMFRCTAAEAVGQSLDRFIPPRFRSSHSKDIRKFGKTGVTTRTMAAARAVNGVRANGEEFPVEASISQIKVGGQKLYTVIMRDITERKLVEEARQSSELRYRRLFESAKDGILILDALSGRIVDVNPYLIEMLGYSKEELAGKELWEIGVFKDIIASKLAFTELRQRGYIRYENLPLESREGLVRQVEFVSNSYLAGESRVIQCNIRDITERKLAEEDLRQTNKSLEGALAELQTKTHELASMTQQLWQASKLATMGELAASIAHELNNPLATISLHAEVLVGQLAADDRNRRSLLVIEQEVERMASLVSNLLLFSRRSHKQISTIDIGEELQNSLEFINYHLRSHRINVATDFADDLPSVHADRQHLREVFLNLLTNASDAMPEGGTLTVRAKQQVLETGAPAVMIEFSDSGAGVEPEDLAKLWEPFFTTKPEGKGTGLGLPICRRTVEEHGGTIDIESLPGKGTTVRIILPATETGAVKA